MRKTDAEAYVKVPQLHFELRLRRPRILGKMGNFLINTVRRIRREIIDLHLRDSSRALRVRDYVAASCRADFARNGAHI